jgi:hypothetical protein
MFIIYIVSCLAAASSLIVFSFAANTLQQTSSSVLSLPVQVTNPGGRNRNSAFTAASNGIHFIEVCAAPTSGTVAQVSKTKIPTKIKGDPGKRVFNIYNRNAFVSTLLL